MNQTKDVKAVLLGDVGVGKSSLMLRFVNNEYFEENTPTLGAAFLAKTICVQKQQIKFQIWDTAGSERYKAILPLYYRDAKVAIIVYDVSNPNSYLIAQQWVAELQDSAPADQIKVIVGNKTDKQSLVDFDTVKQYAQEQNLIPTLACCRLDQGVTVYIIIIEEIFVQVAELLIPKMRTESEMNSMRLSLKSPKKSKGCC